MVGRLTQNVSSMTLSDSGKLICNFNLAVKRNYRDATDFIRIVAWENVARNIEQYTKKGDMIYVTGYLQVRQYTGDDGKERYVHEVVASQVQFLERKEKKENAFEETNIDEGNDTPF